MRDRRAAAGGAPLRVQRCVARLRVPRSLPSARVAESPRPLFIVPAILSVALFVVNDEKQDEEDGKEEALRSNEDDDDDDFENDAAWTKMRKATMTTAWKKKTRT